MMKIEPLQEVRMIIDWSSISPSSWSLIIWGACWLSYRLTTKRDFLQDSLFRFSHYVLLSILSWTVWVTFAIESIGDLEQMWIYILVAMFLILAESGINVAYIKKYIHKSQNA